MKKLSLPLFAALLLGALLVGCSSDSGTAPKKEDFAGEPGQSQKAQ